MASKPKREPREVEIVRPDYQPSKAELEADARIDATFEEAIDALCRPVDIRYVDRPR
ncbi:MAG: hypothetical protein OXF56_05865 [Rhodobacteraceae bacterium]|nr:hypothetical protein [Paracoccaceae bacterium]